MKSFSQYAQYVERANEASENLETDIDGEPGHVMTWSEWNKARNDFLAERAL